MGGYINDFEWILAIIGGIFYFQLPWSAMIVVGLFILIFTTSPAKIKFRRLAIGTVDILAAGIYWYTLFLSHDFALVHIMKICIVCSGGIILIRAGFHPPKTDPLADPQDKEIEYLGWAITYGMALGLTIGWFGQSEWLQMIFALILGVGSYTSLVIEEQKQKKQSEKENQ